MNRTNVELKRGVVTSNRMSFNSNESDQRGIETLCRGSANPQIVMNESDQRGIETRSPSALTGSDPAMLGKSDPHGTRRVPFWRAPNDAPTALGPRNGSNPLRKRTACEQGSWRQGYHSSRVPAIWMHSAFNRTATINPFTPSAWMMLPLIHLCSWFQILFLVRIT